MLRDAAFRESYVWMELLCIPQDEWDDDQAKIRQREIPRQAIIFRNARIAVAWLNVFRTGDILKRL